MKQLGRILVGVVCVAFGAFVFALPFYQSAPSVDPQSTASNTTITKWAYWDGESDKPKANVLVTADEASGNSSYGYGNIRGRVFNRTHNAFSYIQVTFGLYTESGVKFATCMDNMSNLGQLDVWEFNAPCLEWRANARYSVDSITYR